MVRMIKWNEPVKSCSIGPTRQFGNHTCPHFSCKWQSDQNVAARCCHFPTSNVLPFERLGWQAHCSCASLFFTPMDTRAKSSQHRLPHANSTLNFVKVSGRKVQCFSFLRSKFHTNSDGQKKKKKWKKVSTWQSSLAASPHGFWSFGAMCEGNVELLCHLPASWLALIVQDFLKKWKLNAWKRSNSTRHLPSW